MSAVFRRELRSYFQNLHAYVYMAFMLLFAGIFVSVINLKNGYANFEYALLNMNFIFLIVIPILTMRIFAEERHQRTDQLLYSLPISMPKIVLGKYCSMLVVLALPMVLLCGYPPILVAFGEVNYLTAYSTLLAYFFLAAALGAIGMFLSSLTENQGIAAGVCFAVMLLLYFMGTLSSSLSTSAATSILICALALLAVGGVCYLLMKNAVLSALITVLLEALLAIAALLKSGWFEGLVPSVLEKLSLFDRLESFAYGELDLTALFFYVTIAGLFLFLSVQSMEKRRWNG